MNSGSGCRNGLTDETKRWKFRLGDLDDRARWDDFTKAYRAILKRTSTKHAPWYIVPADDEDVRDWLIAKTIADALEDMELGVSRGGCVARRGGGGIIVLRAGTIHTSHWEHMQRMRARSAMLAIMTLLLASPHAEAQRRGGYFSACTSSLDAHDYFVSPFFRGNPGYDGRVTFARIKYKGLYECGAEGPGWAHDYPRTDVHFMRILREVTKIKPFVERGPILGSTLVRLDDAEIFNYPVAYLSEPGGWTMNDAEMAGLKRYIKQGGFIIFDDIEGEPNPDYRNLLEQWRRVFPNARPIRLTNDHPIFNTFFAIDLSKIPSKMRRVPAEYLGFFEDNDPKKRMVAIIDNYADIGEYIEFSDEGLDMVPANEAYKLWVNYFIYALTH